MGDVGSVITTQDAEEHVLAATQHIVKALGASKNLNDDVRSLLADLDIQLSMMTKLTESKPGGGTREVENQLKFAQRKVIRWESNQSKIWYSGAEEVSEYLQAVCEIQRLTAKLRSLHSNKSGKQKELLDQANGVLQIAMERLEEELIHILKRNKRSFEAEYVSFRSCEEDVVDGESVISVGEDSIEDASRRESIGSEAEDHVVDLVHPDVISDIKSIANVMFTSHYDREFCLAFVNFWKEALEECFVILGIETPSIKDLLKMKWKFLYYKIKKWIRAMKIVVRVYLASQKRLFHLVLGEFGSVCSTCFIESCQASMLCLLNFGQAIAIGPRGAEKLFSLLDMYETLADLLQDIDSLFSGEVGSLVRTEFRELLVTLGDSAKATFMEFGNAVASNASTYPFPGGGVHHLTRYIMNYINTVVDYATTLNLLLGVQGGEDSVLVGTEDTGNISSHCFCPLAHHLRLMIAILESNLDGKSRLYRDSSLKHIFIMNNIHYMVGKVKGSELGAFYGDEWIREYTGKFQQHATCYERVTWSSILSLLRDDRNPGKEILKERCRSFNVAFERVYKSQTGWFIADSELRKDLRISTSQKVIHAYRNFTSKISSTIYDKYIKYTADDLENCILNLFEGSSRSLHVSRKGFLIP